MRHIAAEGRCWVLGSGCSMQARDIPDSFPERDRLYPDPDKWLNPGDSIIVAPGGKVVAGPLHEAHGILYAEVDPALADAAHYTLDAAGHYNRPDIFSLTVRRGPRTQVAFEEVSTPGWSPVDGTEALTLSLRLDPRFGGLKSLDPSGEADSARERTIISKVAGSPFQCSSSTS